MRAEKYILLEATEKATTNLGRDQIKKKTKAHQEEHPRKEARASSVAKYHEYTPFNVLLADLYKEVGQVERFPKLKALKIKTSANRSLFYKYHNGFSHRTKDYYDLLDAMEQLIWEGRLVKYIASQRSPRKRKASPIRDEEN